MSRSARVWLACADQERALTQGSDPAPDKDKVIVLLTDGDNTQNRWSTSGSSIDARTALACANAKADNIKIYTVRVIDGDANLLRNCATKPNMYYNVNQASELNSVFSSIAQNRQLADCEWLLATGAETPATIDPIVADDPSSMTGSRNAVPRRA